MARDELAGLPHSLGYEFTHLPKIDAVIGRAQGRGGHAQQPAAVDGADRDDARRYRALVATGKYVPAMQGWGLACGSAKASKAELDAAADALTAKPGGSDNDRRR